MFNIILALVVATLICSIGDKVCRMYFRPYNQGLDSWSWLVGVICMFAVTTIMGGY